MNLLKGEKPPCFGKYKPSDNPCVMCAFQSGCSNAVKTNINKGYVNKIVAALSEGKTFSPDQIMNGLLNNGLRVPEAELLVLRVLAHPQTDMDIQGKHVVLRSVKT